MVMDGPARDSTSKALPPPGEPCELPCERAWQSDMRRAFGEACSVIPAPGAIVPAAIGFGVSNSLQVVLCQTFAVNETQVRMVTKYRKRSATCVSAGFRDIETTERIEAKRNIRFGASRSNRYIEITF